MADPFIQEIQDEFRSEAEEMLTDLEQNILNIERNPNDKDALKIIFRALHTIKGTGAAVEFYRLSAFVHHFEDAFDLVIKGKLVIRKKLTDLALGGFDRIRELLKEASTEPCAKNEIVEQEPLLTQLRQYITATLAGADQEEAPTEAAATGIPAEPHTFHLTLGPPSGQNSPYAEPVRLLNALQMFGTSRIVSITRDMKLKGRPPRLRYTIELIGDISMALLQQACDAIQLSGELRVEDVTCADETTLILGPFFAVDVLPAFQSACTVHLERLKQHIALFEKDPLHEKAGRDLVDTCATFSNSIMNLLAIVPDQQKNDNALTRIIALLHAASEKMAWLTDQEQGQSARIPVNTFRQWVESVASLVNAFMEEEPPPNVPEAVATAFARDGLFVRNAVPASAASAAVPTSERVEAPAISTLPKQGDAKTDERGSETATLRVEESKINHIMRAVGDLLTRRTMLPLLAKRMLTDTDRRELSGELIEASREISVIAEDLQDAVMSIRMMPVANLFKRYPRMIRDLAGQLDKEIDLVLDGGETEMDKVLLDQVNDPLVHLLRNAVDHGIELPQKRIEAGKPPKGVIRLSASRAKGIIHIQISDDGNGLDAERLKAKAVERDLITAAEAQRMSDSDAYRLIFHAGFSTAEKVTDVSGRGVGMDVVMANIRGLHGHVDLESEPGKGSTVTLRFPVKNILMVSEALLTRSGGEEYLIPVENVLELHKVPPETLHDFHETRLITLRNEVFPVADLFDLLNPGGERTAEKALTEAIPLALIRSGKSTFALILDKFVSREEVVVKPLTGAAVATRVFSGVSVMGDGRVVLVIDPAELMELMIMQMRKKP